MIEPAERGCGLGAEALSEVVDPVDEPTASGPWDLWRMPDSVNDQGPPKPWDFWSDPRLVEIFGADFIQSQLQAAAYEEQRLLRLRELQRREAELERELAELQFARATATPENSTIH